jgi:erythromycin esterase-like protein
MSLSLVSAQSKSISWVNENAHKLRSDSVDDYQDLLFLSDILRNKRIVGLGEASHGTQEFYFQKSRFVRYLVSRENYKIIAIESPTKYIEPINDYILTGAGNIKGLLQPLGLYNSEELFKLCKWLKIFNASKPWSKKVQIMGFDKEEYWSDPYNRDKLMAQNFTEKYSKNHFKSILWAHNLHLAKDTTMAQFKAMGGYLKKEYNDKFYVIFFDTYSGSVNVLNNTKFESHHFNGNEKTISAMLSKGKFDTFFVDFNKSSSPFVNKQFLITNIYSDWRREPTPLSVIPGSDFDGLVFIRETTASKMIE